MKKLHGIHIAAAVLCCAALSALLSITAGAAVTSTAEPTGEANTVYVAGNPNWYPVEYYNPETKCYEGILPLVLERVSEKTGISFTYVLAGEEDQRARLAQNGQVEMVSGVVKGDPEPGETGLLLSETVLTAPGEDQLSREVCFAFTEIAGSDLTAVVLDALGKISPQEITELTIQFTAEHPKTVVPKWFPILAVVVGALFLLTVTLLVARIRKYQKAFVKDEEYDIVTGIGNKTYFVRRFEHQIADESRTLYCVAFIGFDIERVNQYYGEAEAEDQLRFAAEELTLNAEDNEFAARVSGGGFAVAHPCGSGQGARVWAEKLLARLNKFTERYGKDYHPDFSMGIYMLQPTDRDCETALFNARQGYRRAVRGYLPYVFASNEALKKNSDAAQLKRQTIDAIQNNEFRMYLQFVVCAADGHISGAEALSRWEHPQRGLLHPHDYVGLMETDKSIFELDFYIFEEACKQLQSWHRQRLTYRISCNFARVSIDNNMFVQKLQSIAEQYTFSRSRLVIEITEDCMESNKEVAFANISKCKELGFLISLDDAGSGYTSFADLRDYPIDIVKIDRSILNAAVTPRGISLLKGIISLIHNMNMEALCEGVETAEQCELLRRLGCDCIQGYYFYRALPQNEANKVLQWTGGRLKKK